MFSPPPSHSRSSLPNSHGNKSMAPTVSTNPDTTHSDAAHSKSGTTTTGAGTNASALHAGGEGSTFSSPAPSERSLTTTLTTVQSAAPATLINGAAPPVVPTANQPPNPGAAPNTSQPSAASYLPVPQPGGGGGAVPASAIPPHVLGPNAAAAAAPTPTTYTAATANNLLTDNASILTLASSSKNRRRRNSLDTNASVRALAPSSLFGGSRESLPLSVLSAAGTAGAGPGGDSSATGTASGGGLAAVHNRPSVGGLPAAERASVYSSSGAVLSSERSSYYAPKADGASVRSGPLGHGRNDSITGSISGVGGWPTPREPVAASKTSRRNSSGWGDVGEVNDEDAEAKGKEKA